MNGYAETHYKFRLPWSPLHRRLPEMIVDAPWMAAPGREVPLFLCVHDAHKFPVTLRTVRVVVRAGGEMQKAERTFDLRLDRPFHWIDLPWPGPKTVGENLVDVLFEIEDGKGRRRKFVNHNLPTLAPQSLSVLRMSEPLPFSDGWTSGDLHCHTSWSEDPVEWGGDPEVMRRAADCQNLGFWAATDHSYDFAWAHPDWLVPTDPIERFRAFRASLPQDEPGRCVVLPAEEVSCGNRNGRNVHLLVIDHPDYLPGQGDGGRRGLRNKPDLSIGQVLAQTARSGAPAFAAHPKPGIGVVQRLLFRRGDWDHADLLPHLHGLQFWNGKIGDDFRHGRALWVADLLRGNRRLPIAGNDAHGDLNRATQVSRPLFQLRQTRSHRFAHARTWIHLESEPTRGSIRAALAADTATILSDGPFLSLRVPGASQAEERSGSGIEVRATSPVEFGKLRTVRVYAHFKGDATEVLLFAGTPDSLDWNHRLDAPAGTLYLRAEAETTQGHRALTRAVVPG